MELVLYQHFSNLTISERGGSTVDDGKLQIFYFVLLIHALYNYPFA